MAYEDSDRSPALPSHLYVHVPFCESKCAYCDFASVADADEETVELVFRGIRTQLRHWDRAAVDGVFETVYFGGGTPTLYPAKVASFLDYVREHFVVHAGAEVTVEGNPDSIDEATVEWLALSGVTRMSVGVQSLDDSDLRMLGRRHDAAAAQAACRAVTDAGLALSLDLMCGVPGQTRSSWAETLEKAVATGAGHLSVYPLTIEPGTPMEVAIGTGLLKDVDPDDAAESMVLAHNALERHGFERYETANYARRSDLRSRHNTAYWTGRAYIGVGPAAHGMLDSPTARAVKLYGDLGPEVARVRYGNAPSIEDWFLGRGDSLELLGTAEALREDAMLGLRLTEGITEELAEKAGVVAVLEELSASGLVEHVAKRWRTTRSGWLLGNEVFGRVWSGE